MNRNTTNPTALPREYLLFAGSSPQPIGGRESLIARFIDEREARDAFVDWRVRTTSPEGWAQLVTVDDARRVDVVCWFGPEARLPRSRPTCATPTQLAPETPCGKENKMNGKGITAVSDTGRAIADRPTEPQPLRSSRNRQRRPWIAVALGVLFIAGASVLLKGGASSPPGDGARPSAEKAVPVPVLQGGDLVGHEVVRTEHLTFAAHTARPLVSDAGLHQVRVVAGTVTIEGSNGERSHYGPGAGYVAGWTPYVVRNDTTEPTEVLVSYLRPKQAAQGSPQPAPSD